jgi:hypothetical protein
MKITGLYIYLDGSDLAGVAEEIESSLTLWLQENGVDAVVVNERHDTRSNELTDWDLGLILTTDQIPELKGITDFMYRLAVKSDRDFALGYFDEVSGESEDISYFGAECGLPKIGEINEILAARD